MKEKEKKRKRERKKGRKEGRQAGRQRKETYYKELAHMILGAGKSQDPHSASHRHRNGDGVVLVLKLTGIESRKSQCVSWSPKERRG